MRLRDGRVLAWSEWGPLDGLPVVFCTGAGMSGWLGFGASSLPELSLRLLAIDRPGLGASDPHPDKTLDSWVEDTRQWMQVNQLHRLTAVGFSQGAPFAFALAAAGLVEAVAIASGQDELTHPRVRPLLHPDVERMVAAVQQDAAAFERHFAEIATAEVLWQLIHGMSSGHDRALYESNEFGTAYQRALREGFSQGAEGYARDLANVIGSWPFTLESITAPVDLWYGGLDSSTVHSPDFGVMMASRLPNAWHELDSHAGGSILWTRGHDILAQLKSHLS
jgi:pimeloyl-ACP methyl ester carboxylesterase